MSEEIKIKVSQPMFEVGDLERFDTYINEIANEFTKLHFAEKDKILTQRLVQKLEQENERLHSIIKEAREYIEKSKLNQLDTFCKYLYVDEDCNIHNLDVLLEILDKGNK